MSNETTKIIRFHEIGSASVLVYEDISIPAPSDHELLITVKAIGLNRAELMFRNGTYLEAPEFPSRLGYEASGVVQAVGNNVSGFKVGDEVSAIPAFSMGQYGVYGETALVPAHAVAIKPSTLSHEQSASIWMQYVTAYGALFEFSNLIQGQNILITAASSSVGVAAIQLAKAQGANVIVSTRGEGKKQFLLEQGADHVIATDTEKLSSRTMEITDGEGAHVIFDPIGGPILADLADAASQNGKIIEYGALDSNATPYPLFTALAKGLVIKGYTLFEITEDESKLERAKAFLTPMIESGQIVPVIDKVFRFEEIQEAHEYMESNQQQGKIVVRV